jgi:hypothetical protein
MSLVLLALGMIAWVLLGAMTARPVACSDYPGACEHRMAHHPIHPEKVVQ